MRENWYFKNWVFLSRSFYFTVEVCFLHVTVRHFWSHIPPPTHVPYKMWLSAGGHWTTPGVLQTCHFPTASGVWTLPLPLALEPKQGLCRRDPNRVKAGVPSPTGDSCIFYCHCKLKLFCHFFLTGLENSRYPFNIIFVANIFDQLS